MSKPGEFDPKEVVRALWQRYEESGNATADPLEAQLSARHERGTPGGTEERAAYDLMQRKLATYTLTARMICTGRRPAAKSSKGGRHA